MKASKSPRCAHRARNRQPIQFAGVSANPQNRGRCLRRRCPWLRLKTRSRGAREGFLRVPASPREKGLFEYHDYHAAVFRAAFAGLVRRHRQRVAVGDRRHAVQRELRAAGEVAADFVGAALAELVVQLAAAGVVRVSLDFDVVLLVQRLDLAGEVFERGLCVLVQLVGTDFELDAVFLERLLENDLALGQHARFLRALESVLRLRAELRDGGVGLLKMRVSRLLLVLQIFDLTFDRLDLLRGLRLRVGDLLIDRFRRRACAECGRQRRGGEDTDCNRLLNELPFLSVCLFREATWGGSVPRYPARTRTARARPLSFSEIVRYFTAPFPVGANPIRYCARRSSSM